MKVRLVPALALLIFAAVAHVQAEPAADAIITKARSVLGSERDLNGVKSIHFKGTLETIERVPDPADARKTVTHPVRLAIDIVFQKPMQQRFTLRSDKLERITGLDEYDGWEKLMDSTTPTSPRLVLLDAPTIRRLRANTWENLGFYRGIEKHGGVVRYVGDIKVDGIDCAKVSFTYFDTIVFTRYFNKSTGKLVRSDMDNGMELREEGEQTVKGVRFPKKLIQRAPNGSESVITFDEITVNEPVPPTEFAMPAVPTR
jgi:hypothetical protein